MNSRYVVVVLVAAAGVSGCSNGGSRSRSVHVGLSSSHGVPFFREVQVQHPKRLHGSCSAPRVPVAKAKDAPAFIDPDPSGGTAVWQPGLNSAGCQALTTQLTAARATALAHEVDHDRVIPATASFACPADDGSRVDIYFSYADTRTELIDIALNGCRFVSAPGRSARYAPEWTGGTSVLSAVTPRGWVLRNSGH